MIHLDEGTLQAFLDDEIAGGRRAAAAEHLLVCGECRGALDALKRANETLSAALAELDTAPPTAALPPGLARHPRRGFRLGSLARAAVLVLLVAAAASASVPGSPVRAWIVQAVRPEPPTTPPPAAPAVVEEPVAETPATPVGIALPGIRRLDIVVQGATDASIRLTRTPGDGVVVSSRGAVRDPLFRMGADRIEVVGGAGGELVVEVPRSDASVRLIVDGRRYAETVNGELRVLEPADQDGDAVVWR